MQVGRPKDLAKRQMILEAAKSLFLKQGFHGSTMNQIAQEAGVTKLTVYNHFQDKANLFTCAIEQTCEESIRTRPIHLQHDSNFTDVLAQICHLALNIIYLPEALKLEHLLLELAAEQNPLAEPFYNASHKRLYTVWADFFEQAISLGFVENVAVEKQVHLLLSLLLGHRHHEILLGVRDVPTTEESKQIIADAIELFLMKYQKTQ